MIDNALLSPTCLECPVCSPGCSPIASGLHPTQGASMRRVRCDLLSQTDAPVPRQCWHCAQAPGVDACPAGAMRRDAGKGLVWVDRSRCVGCWMCVLACPFGAVLPSADGKFAVKCDGCLRWETPACAGSCHPRDALFAPESHTVTVLERRAAYAAAGWGWPGTGSYPDPRTAPRSIPGPAASPHPGRYVIVGAGIAAVRAAETLRASDPRGEIVVVSDESTPPYSRVLLPHYIAGIMGEPSLALRSPNWQDDLDVEVVAGDGAAGLDGARRQVVLRSGRELRYDRMLVATGAVPRRLPIPGADLEGVIGLRNLPDAAATRLFASSDAVIVGGGFIGIKAAEALRQLGTRVTIVEKLGQLLPQTLDGPAAEMVQERLEAHGVRVRTGIGIREIEGRGRATGVLLESGERLPAGLVVVSVGVTPNVTWLRGSSLRLHRGVIVDEQMRTNVPEVWAAGDVAECCDALTGQRAVPGLWPVAATQGRIAGANLAGDAERFDGFIPVNTLNIFGLAVASFGQVTGGDNIVSDRGSTRYQKKVYRGEVLVGAALVGDLREAGRLLAEARCAQPSCPLVS